MLTEGRGFNHHSRARIPIFPQINCRRCKYGMRGIVKRNCGRTTRSNSRDKVDGLPYHFALVVLKAEYIAVVWQRCWFDSGQGLTSCKSVRFNSVRRGTKVLYAQEAWRRDLRNSCPWSFLQLYALVAQRIRACVYET